MNLKRIEALADAIASLNQYSDPESEAYQLRNPGMMRAVTLSSLATATDDCIRRFETHQGGYKCLTDNLQKKCKYSPHLTLSAVLAHFKHGNEFALRDALVFISKSLGSKIKPDVRLSYFTE